MPPLPSDQGVLLEERTIGLPPPVRSAEEAAACVWATAGDFFMLVLLTAAEVGDIVAMHGLATAAALAAVARAACLLASSEFALLALVVCVPAAGAAGPEALPVSQTLTVPSLTRVNVKRGMMVMDESNVPPPEPLSEIVIEPVELCI